MEYRVRPLDQETRERLQLEEGYGPDVVAVDRMTSDWEFVGYSNSKEDAATFISKSNDPLTHSDFFKGKIQHRSDVAASRLAEAALEATPQEVRQLERRSAAFQQLLTVAQVPRQDGGTSSRIIDVTWEEFQVMHKEYADAQKQGRAKECAFQPLSAYHNKIVQTNDDGTVKRILRHPMSNEVGMVTLTTGVKIVRLKDQGPGDLGGKYFQVPKEGGKTE